MTVKKITEIDKNSNVLDVLDTQLDFAKKGVYYNIDKEKAAESSLVFTENGRKLNSVSNSNFNPVWYLKDSESVTNSNLQSVAATLARSGGVKLADFTIANDQGGAGVVTDQGLIKTIQELIKFSIDRPLQSGLKMHNLPINSDYQGSINLGGFILKFGYTAPTVNGSNWAKVTYRERFPNRCLAGPFFSLATPDARTVPNLYLDLNHTHDNASEFSFFVTNSITTATGARAAFTWFSIGI